MDILNTTVHLKMLKKYHKAIILQLKKKTVKKRAELSAGLAARVRRFHYGGQVQSLAGNPKTLQAEQCSQKKKSFKNGKDGKFYFVCILSV